MRLISDGGEGKTPVDFVTAVRAPVVAVIEHNHERDGEIIIPAGSRAVGKITQADPSGLMNITFTSIEFPSGEAVPIEAVAANTSLDAVKGRFTLRCRVRGISKTEGRIL